MNAPKVQLKKIRIDCFKQASAKHFSKQVRKTFRNYFFQTESRGTFFEMIDLIAASNSIKKSSKSELSSRFFGRLKFLHPLRFRFRFRFRFRLNFLNIRNWLNIRLNIRLSRHSYRTQTILRSPKKRLTAVRYFRMSPAN